MGKRRWILWQGLIAPSMERFIVGASNGGFELSGLILQAHEEAPYIVRYVVQVDESWRTRRVEVELEDGGRRQVNQSYERLGDQRYRYRSGRFTADLAVDDDGLVLQYGANWKAVATSGELG
jgi:hypothetical protein